MFLSIFKHSTWVSGRAKIRHFLVMSLIGPICVSWCVCIWVAPQVFTITLKHWVEVNKNWAKLDNSISKFITLYVMTAKQSAAVFKDLPGSLRKISSAKKCFEKLCALMQNDGPRIWMSGWLGHGVLSFWSLVCSTTFAWSACKTREIWMIVKYYTM